MKRILPYLVVVLLSFVLVGIVEARDSIIDSINIVEDTIKGIPNCMHYKIAGQCYWLKCSSAECHVEPTLKLDQYLPDAAVSVFTQPTNDPWWYAKMVIDPASYQVGKLQIKQLTHDNLGFGDEYDNSQRDLNN